MKFDKKLFSQTIKQYSYHRDHIDWKKFEKALENTPEKINSAETINSLLSIVDDHSFAVSNNKDEETPAENIKEVTSEKISEDIGFLKLPGFYSPFNNERDLNKNYKNIINALQQLRGCSELLLDLQDNSGGNMYPWFAALAPLYNSEVIGYFDYASKREREAWRVLEEGVFSGDKLWFPQINTDKYGFEKIAVCVSEKTVSSGEAVTLSLMGQENVKLFGEKTGGFTTGNEEFQICDFIIWLSTGMMQNRNKESFPEGIVPDIKSPTAKKAAILWLQSS